MSYKKFVADWLPDDKRLEPYYIGIRNFVNEFLIHPYQDSACYQAQGPKSILDAVVGYVHLNEWEVALLDTRLFQRLRHHLDRETPVIEGDGRQANPVDRDTPAGL